MFGKSFFVSLFDDMPEEDFEYRALKSGLMSDPELSSSRYLKDHNRTNEIFKVEFPLPEPPRQNFSPSLIDPSTSIFHNSEPERAGYGVGYVTTRSCLMFRRSDSTERTLKLLKIKRQNAKMKKKALILVSSLLILALSILNVSIRDNGTRMRNYLLDTALVVDSSEISREVVHTNVFENSSELPPEEEMIEERKEFLQPFRYFADLTTPRRSSDSNFFFHISV